MFSYRIDDDIDLRLLQEKHSEELFELMDKNQRFVEAFCQSEARLRDQAGPWALPLRKAAISRFSNDGFPARKDEEWRFTNIRKLIGAEWDQ